MGASRFTRPTVAALVLAALPGRTAASGGALGETLLTRPVRGGGCIESPLGEEQCLELAPGGLLHEAVATTDGWIAAGTRSAGRYRDLLLLAERRGEIAPLPLPPAGRGGPRGGPTPLASDGELVGLAWLEGTHAEGLAVWASAWRDGGWSPPQEIASPGPRLALTGAVLADGSWLLAWTEFDGTDDETVFTIAPGGRDAARFPLPSADGGSAPDPARTASGVPTVPAVHVAGHSLPAPRRLHADDEVPDIEPDLLAVGDGALAAWSRFDGRDYRLHLARLEEPGWRELGPLPGAGATRADFLEAGDHPWLLYRSVEPEAWHLLALDESGAVTTALRVDETSMERPVVHLEGANPWLEWPSGGGTTPAEVPISAIAGRAPAGETFRYMAFGDSITAGKGDECNPDCDDMFSNCGYPTRLPTDPYLDCDANACEVVNKGKGGETTGQGLSRIDNVLDDEGPWDEVLLMEATNDICWNDVSNNTIEANLGAMEGLAEDRGVETVHASIIHICGDRCEPDFQCPTNLPDPEGRVADLRDRIRDELANLDADTSHLWWSDPWSELCPTEACFDAHYADWGHPDCSGYDIMADVFRDAIQARAVPGPVVAIEPTGTTSDTSPSFIWNKEIPRDATWYQFQLDGPGGNLEDTWFLETEACAPWQCTLELGTFPEGTYTWRARGRNSAGRSAWVETTFTIQTVVPPGLPTAVAPVGTIGDERPTFTWLRESPITATGYELEVSDDSGVILDATFPAFGSCLGTTCAVDPFEGGEPLAAGDYSWRVRGSNAAGSGPWTGPLAFSLIPGLIFLDGFESGDTGAWAETQL